MKHFFVYACKPCIEDYMGNWAVSYMNRLWIWICCIVNPLTMSINGLLIGLAHEKKWLIIEKHCFTIFIIMTILFIINVIQRVIFESSWDKIEQHIFKSNEKFEFITSK